MGQIGNKTTKTTPPSYNGGDKLIGTDITDGNKTKNFTLTGIKEFADNPTSIKEVSGSLVGGDVSIATVRGLASLDIQGKRDAVDLSHLFWGGTIPNFEDAGGGSVKAYYQNSGVELEDGDSVTISTTTNYNGVYTIFNVITDVEDSFEFTATWVATETGTWSNQRQYDILRPNENKNDNAWSLEAQTEFFAEAPASVTMGIRTKSLEGWGGDWSQGAWGFNGGYQNILGGKGCTVIGNNIISENYWCTAVGNHIHNSEWSTTSVGNWLIGQGGDGLLLGSNLDTYGWRNINVGNNSYVGGNESQNYGTNNTIHDAFGINLNETPDALHNRYNLSFGQNNTIGSTSDLGDKATGSITVFTDKGDSYHVTVTSVGHGLLEGDAVSITGTTSYNGKFTADNVTTDTFDINATWVADDATGTWTQNYTVNNVLLIGENNQSEKNGATCIGKNLVNLHEDSIEIGVNDDAKLAVRSDGTFVFPEAITTEPTTETLPNGHYTMWYGDIPLKLKIYRNNNGVIESTTIGQVFA